MSKKAEAKLFYDSWRKSPSFCPAFNKTVVISLKGWRHITGQTGDKKRLIQDVHRRLHLLPHAKTITEKSHTIQNITVKKGIEYHALEAMMKVTEKGVDDMRKVRVIFMKDKAGNYTFISVMDRKI